MSDVRKPRRWPWGVLVVLALSAGGPIAWRFRPLNATEKKLVGRWQLLADGSVYELDARRRYLHPGTGGRGSWSASQGRIEFRSDLLGPIAAQSWASRLSHSVRSFFDSGTTEIRFDGPDRFFLNGLEVARIRD